MDGPKDLANATTSAAHRKDPTAKAHDEARREVKDLLDRRGNGEPTAALRKRKGVYGCDIMRDKAPDHDHRLKDEAYCRELMALTTYRLRDVVQNAEGHWLRVGCERVATGCVPLAPTAISAEWTQCHTIANSHD